MEEAKVCLGAYLRALKGDVGASVKHFSDICNIVNDLNITDRTNGIDLTAGVYKNIVGKILGDKKDVLAETFSIASTRFFDCDNCGIREDCQNIHRLMRR